MEADYRRVTVNIAVAAGRALVEQTPGMTFIFVSGTGADETGKSRTMWARVKGEAENAIFALPFKTSFVFRPAFIRPLHGIALVPGHVLGHEADRPARDGALSAPGHDHREARARHTLNVARPKRILDTPDINAAAGGDTA